MIHSARMTLRSVTASDLEAMAGEAMKAAEQLATAGVGVIVYGCTSGSLLRGVEWEKSLVSGIGEETGIPTVSTAGAAVEGLSRRRTPSSRRHAIHRRPEPHRGTFP